MPQAAASRLSETVGAPFALNSASAVSMALCLGVAATIVRFRPDSLMHRIDVLLARYHTRTFGWIHCASVTYLTSHMISAKNSTVRYSSINIIRQAFSGHRHWEPAWRKAQPKQSYEVVIVGGGGHGLATAYYLAKNHGVKKIAVLEKGWIGAGNVGRNTTIIRSNYLLPQNTPFFEWSLKLWETLEQDLNYNTMVSQRGVLNLFHSEGQRDSYALRANNMRLH